MKNKFRVWDKLAKRMSTEFSLFGEFTLVGGVFSWMSESGLGHDLTRLNDLVELSFTGLTDKNGKEIYEGDIVQLWFADKIDFISEVFFKDGAFSVYRGGNKNSIWNLHGWTGRWEIIGNIYEHPDLLHPKKS